MPSSKVVFSSLLIVIICLLGSKVNAVTIPDFQGEVYVQDFAKVLTKEQKKELLELGLYLDEHTDANLVVLTVDSLQGKPVEEFALYAFQQYQLENMNKKGILLLLALNDRKIRIEIGYGLDGTFPDEKLGQILDRYSLSYLEEGNLGLALTNTYKQLFNEVSSEYKLNKKADAQAHKYNSNNSPFSFIAVMIFSLIVVGVIFLDFRLFKGALTLSIIRLLSFPLRRKDRRSTGRNR